VVEAVVVRSNLSRFLFGVERDRGGAVNTPAVAEKAQKVEEKNNMMKMRFVDLWSVV
jgi:hypothetical protein